MVISLNGKLNIIPRPPASPKNTAIGALFPGSCTLDWTALNQYPEPNPKAQSATNISGVIEAVLYGIKKTTVCSISARPPTETGTVSSSWSIR